MQFTIKWPPSCCHKKHRNGWRKVLQVWQQSKFFSYNLSYPISYYFKITANMVFLNLKTLTSSFFVLLAHCRKSIKLSWLSKTWTIDVLIMSVAAPESADFEWHLKAQDPVSAPPKKCKHSKKNYWNIFFFQYYTSL